MAATEDDAERQGYQQKFHNWLLNDVGITPSMAKALQEVDDDWTFIIKIHALLEVGLNHMVTGQLRRKELADVIERLPIQGKSGKIAFAKACGSLLDKGAVKFIGLISGVRRDLVHGIKHFDFSLDKYLQALDKSRQHEWKQGLTFNLPDTVDKRLRDFAFEWPRFSIFNGAMSIMAYSFHSQPVSPLDLYRDAMRQHEKRQSESSSTEQ